MLTRFTDAYMRPSDAYMRWIGSALVQVIACRLSGAKSLPEPMLPYCQLDPWEQTSVNFESKFKKKTCLSWKCVSKCRLRSGGHFVQGRWVNIDRNIMYTTDLPAEWTNTAVGGKELLCCINTVLGGVIRGMSVDVGDSNAKSRTTSHLILPFLYEINRTIIWLGVCFAYIPLTHWNRDKIAAVSQTTFWNAFSWMEMYEFRFRFHWNLFLSFQLTRSKH